MNHNLIGANVHTRDDRDAGRVWRVAFDPNAGKVTHIIIHKGFLTGRNVVVPMANVDHVEDDHIHLNIGTSELHALPDFQETDFLPPEEGWEYPLAYPPGGVVWPMSLTWAGASTYPVLSNAVVKENIPEQDVTIDAGTHVECVDGHCGRIDRVIVNDDTQDVVGFVIRKGMIFTRDIEATMDWVDHVDDRGVHLKLTKAEVDQRSR
ncbi:PRC-barrel domain protein [compost metagenome]